MGHDGGEPERYEGPVHQVTIGYSFAAGRFELTNGQYRRFVQASGQRSSGGGCNIFYGDKAEVVAGANWADPAYGRPIRDDEPVACITWSAAQTYVSWLAGVTGKKYRLLTEVEWEYAACKFGNIHDASGAKSSDRIPYGPAPCDDGSVQLAVGCDRRGSRPRPGGAYQPDFRRPRSARPIEFCRCEVTTKAFLQPCANYGSLLWSDELDVFD